MKTILFLRHFPTGANHMGIFMGRNDIDISPDYDQDLIGDLRERILKEELCAVYSSPLIRCVHTAELVCPKDKILIDDRLVEKDLGDWQGKSRNYVVRSYPDHFTPDGKMVVALQPPNGERYDDFTNRIVSFLNDIIDNDSISKCLVVTHGGVIAFIGQLTGWISNETDAVDTHSIKHGVLYSFSFQDKIML